MKKLVALLLVAGAMDVSAQIDFKTDKIKVTEVEKLEKVSKPTVMYFEMTYGNFDIINNPNVKKLENKIVVKIQYVYSDYPKDFDYSELTTRRFAAFYIAAPFLNNKPWIEWEIIKQTGCKNDAEASRMFHGFMVTLKEGPEPNAKAVIPPDIIKKMEKLDVKLSQVQVKTAKEIVDALTGKGVEISNLTFSKSGGSVNTFNAGENTIPIVKGLLMTTGSVENAIGPNNSPSATTVVGNNVANNKYLLPLVEKGAKLFDACQVEFDVEIDADSLVFRYIFASEEYPEYLEFNDVFGLFITGKGINGNPDESTVNLAVLPDKKTVVSVKNINHLKNKHLYFSNDYTGNLKIFKIMQYDGFTKAMTARVKVIPKQKYHVVFAIADFGDPYYDSGIFLEAMGIKAK